MGFERKQVLNLILYESERIDGNVNEAVDYLIKTDEGWTHHFVNKPSSEPFAGTDLENSFMMRCIICGEIP